MGHGITKTDMMALAGQRAWHGLGRVLPDAFTTAEALEYAQLDWKVLQHKLVTEGGQTVGDYVANVRSDTGDVLGIVGQDYHVLQNRDLATFVDDVVGSADNVKLETAGSLRGGREVFMLARMESFDAVKGDEVARYGLFSNSHDGSKRFRVLPTSVRVVCANTLGMALNSGRRDGIAIKHCANMFDAIEEARAGLLAAQDEGKKFEHLVRGLVSRPMAQEELQSFFANVYQRANRLKIPAKPSTESEARALRKATRVVGDWVALLEDDKQQLPGMAGTAWAALNAVTEWADHSRTVRVTETTGNGAGEGVATAEARALSNWVGSCADWKKVALQQAVAVLDDVKPKTRVSTASPASTATAPAPVAKKAPARKKAAKKASPKKKGGA